MEDSQQNRQQANRFAHSFILKIQNPHMRQAHLNFINGKDDGKTTFVVDTPCHDSLMRICIDVFEEENKGKPIATDDVLDKLSNIAVDRFFEQQKNM